MGLIKNLFVFIFIAACMIACQGSKKSSKDASVLEPEIVEPTDVVSSIEVIDRRQPPALVYKTVGNFDDNVPIIMDESRTEIISYPASIDIYQGNQLAKPLKLKDGYLLDNRGINQNVVFLTYTYDEYGKMKNPPSLSEMKSHIKEKYPLKELIDCGPRLHYKNEEQELNALIDAGFPGCKKIIIR